MAILPADLDRDPTDSETAKKQLVKDIPQPDPVDLDGDSS
jgi:hypothetical protein